jgi:hypothetical protein
MKGWGACWRLVSSHNEVQRRPETFFRTRPSVISHVITHCRSHKHISGVDADIPCTQHLPELTSDRRHATTFAAGRPLCMACQSDQAAVLPLPLERWRNSDAAVMLVRLGAPVIKLIPCFTGFSEDRSIQAVLCWKKSPPKTPSESIPNQLYSEVRMAQATSLESGQIRHLLRVTAATSRLPERDTLVLLLGLTAACA